MLYHSFDFNRHRKSRKVYRVLMGKPGGKRPLGRPRCRWKDGLRMELRAQDTDQ
jgi:hypothetical protein